MPLNTTVRISFQLSNGLTNNDNCPPITKTTEKPVMAVVTDSVTKEPISGASVCLTKSSFSKKGEFGGTSDNQGRIILGCPSNLYFGLFSANNYNSKGVRLP